MSSSPCSLGCGAPLPGSVTQNDLTVRCPSCAGTEASLPWWVEAAPPAPPAPPDVTAIAPVRRPRRFRLFAAAAAVLLLLAGGLLVFRPAPRTNADDERTIRPDRADVLPVEGGRVAQGSEAKTPPAAEEAEVPAAPEPPRRNAAVPQPDRAAEAPAASEPPPLTAWRPEVKPPPAAKADGPPTLHRLDTTSEEDLRRLAATAPEVGLGPTGPAVLNSYLTHVPANEVVLAAPALTDAAPLLDVRPDLRMLPIHFGDTCKLNGKLTVSLDELSRKLRAYLDRFTPEGPNGRTGSPEKLRTMLLGETRGKKPEWLRPEAVPALLQILMGEETPFRKVLVEVLARIDGPEATTALAQRAAFDLSPELREAAVAALKGRPAEQYRPVLLKALRYPWAVPAQHAAEALVALRDAGSVPVLVSLLRLPDPAGPLTIHKDRHILQDVVRIDHLNNCMVCHPPSATANDPVLGVDPVVTLPAVRQTRAILNTTQQVMGGYSKGAAALPGRSVPVPGTNLSVEQLPLLIRGDITFLRQDFTVRLPAATGVRGRPAAGTTRRRFDFVLRTRIVPRKLLARMEEVVADRPSYPQRDAVLFALRELTGKDAGPTTEAWVQLYPHAEADAEAIRLSRRLLKAEPVERGILLAKCRDGEGEAYTKALAYAVSGLRGAVREHVRGVLIERMAHLPPDELRQRLRDDDVELRRAALLACARKEDKQLVPDLIPLLDHPKPITSRLAEEGLASLTGEHFSTPTAWKGWWDQHGAAKEK